MGYFMDFIGGMLNSGDEIVESRLKEDAQTRKEEATLKRQEESDIRKDSLATQREITKEQLKEAFEQSKKQATYERLQKESGMIDSEARNIDFKRNKGLINAVSNTVPMEGEYAGNELTPEDIETIRKNMKPEDAEKYYGIKPQTELSKADDKVAAAANVGAFESRPALESQRKQLFETDKADRKDKQESEKIRAKEARDEATQEFKEKQLAETQRKNDAMIARALRGDGGRQGSEKVMSYMDGRRKEIASEAADINKQMAADLKDVYGEKEKAKVREQYQPKLDSIAKERAQLSKDFAKIRTNFNLPPLDEETETKPQAVKPQATASIARPTSKSAFDALPSGATYINPADGKTYKKK